MNEACAVDPVMKAVHFALLTKNAPVIMTERFHLCGRVHGCAPMNESCTVDPVMKAAHFAMLTKNAPIIILTEQLAEVENGVQLGSI